MRSLVVIAPIALWPSVIAMNLALGNKAGPGVPLSATGSDPATHRGLHTWANDPFIAIATGQVTPEVDGYTQEQIDGLVSALHVYVDVTLTKRALFNHALEELSLKLIETTI